jgi:DNA sulfur modification protein DndD
MLFLDLMVDNFGVFHGKHTFNLAPCSTENQSRHLTIISGHNGSGKTTLFQAGMIALHGSLFPGEGGNSSLYHSFLQNRFHRTSDHIAKMEDESGVGITFRYTRSGQEVDIHVERYWRRRGRNLQETLSVSENGQIPDIDPINYQTWLNEFLSPGFARLCFFDAEQLDALASPDQQSVVLRSTLDQLLGLDIIQRLQGDLDVFLYRQGNTAKIDSLYTKVLEQRNSVEELETQIDLLNKDLREVDTSIKYLEEQIAQQERLLASEGGMYAAKRPMLQAQLTTLKKEIENLSNQMRDLCADLLPFALVPELCVQLSMRVSRELEAHRWKVLGTLWQEKLTELKELLLGDSIWEELDVSPQSRQVLVTRIIDTLQPFDQAKQKGSATIIHHLAEPDQQQLKKWIWQAVYVIPQQVQAMGERLRDLKEEQRRIEVELQRVPDDAAIGPIQAKIAQLKEKYSDIKRQQTILSGKLGSLQYQYEEQRRVLKNVVEQYEQAKKSEKQLRFAEKSRLVLRTYQDVLMRQKIQELEQALVTCFNKICHKEMLLSRVIIDSDLNVHLQGLDGGTLHLNNFSAGERQLYGLALLWALRSISQRPLPLMIDTPLARLDEMHRWRFIHDYVPEVSDQVVLFTTDAELDSHLANSIEPYLARSYLLTHNAHLKESIITYNSSCPLDKTSSTKVDERVDAHVV